MNAFAQRVWLIVQRGLHNAIVSADCRLPTITGLCSRQPAVGSHKPWRYFNYSVLILSTIFGLSVLLSCQGVDAGQLPAASPRAGAAPRTSPTQEQPRFSVLVFSKTGGFRHDSIDEGIAAIDALGAAHQFQVDTTEDAAMFTDTQLASYQAVIFLNTTGEILDDGQQAAFERFIRAGGGFVGIHSATDTEYDWFWYHELVGAYFNSHPAIQPAAIDVVDRQHPSTRGLPLRWERTDEWYNFRSAPGTDVTVLATLDETSYSGGAMGASHPIVWYHTYDGGRAWYTALGHTAESYAEPLFLDHLLGGIRWAAGEEASAYLPLIVGRHIGGEEH
jgi:type 1 glutamine amidotransferase